MKIAIDISPLKNTNKFRGVGIYTDKLIEALGQTAPNNLSFSLINDGRQIPKDCDLVHYPYFDLFWLTLPLRKIKPTVVTVHDVTPLVFPEHYPPGIKGGIKLQIQKRSLLGAAAVITDSQSSKKDIFKYLNYPLEKITVIHLAPGKEFKKLPQGSWREETARRYQLPDKFILYVGDVNYNKNVLGLVTASKKVEIPLVIVGKQAAQKDFDKSHIENRPLAKLIDRYGEDKEVRRLGFVSTEDLVKIYNLAAVFCLPSFYEGFGLPVLEAMACGCPVVAAGTSSLPEICNRAAVMVNPDDADNIAEGMKEAIKNREKLVEKGLEQASRFSWKKVADETYKVYQKVVRE